MKERGVSLSARVVASSRAVESEQPRATRVCDDPYARCFLGGRLYLVGALPVPKRLGLWLQRLVAPGFHDYFVARTAFIDDAVSATVASGISQVGILGAGYDSRAYRLRALRAAKVLEVDHPATQQEKIARVRQCVGKPPAHVTFVPMDFDAESLEIALSRTSYDRDARTLFVWEGVTPYLNGPAVEATLEFVARSVHDSMLIFDYLDEDVLARKTERRELVRWVDRTQKMSEPVRFGIKPSNLEDFISSRGLTLIGHARSADLDRLYFRPFNGRRWATPGFAIAQARVP